MSPFFIYGNAGSIIFLENEFKENIGTTGGAIHIEQPNFEIDEKRPFIVMKSNKFFNNMAYFAGNAFHISHKMRMIETNHDSRQVCGAGILIEDNFFYGNIGLKKHNGGAGVIRCQHISTLEDYEELDHQWNSGLIRAEIEQP